MALKRAAAKVAKMADLLAFLTAVQRDAQSVALKVARRAALWVDAKVEMKVRKTVG